MIDGNLATGKRWSRWSVPGEEPTLAELLRDPVIQLMMARDQVDLEDLLSLADRHREIKKR